MVETDYEVRNSTPFNELEGGDLCFVRVSGEHRYCGVVIICHDPYGKIAFQYVDNGSLCLIAHIVMDKISFYKFDEGEKVTFIQKRQEK